MKKRISKARAHASQFKRLRFLITAGPTREYFDPVRYLTNESSGKMGFAIAAHAASCGYAVTLVHGPVALTPPKGVVAVPVVSAEGMLAKCRQAWPRHDVLIMAAAVADYRAKRVAKTKMKKSGGGLVLHLIPNPDVVATLSRARRRSNQVIIGFALEDRNARVNAEEKVRRKGLDAIVLNGPAALSADVSLVEMFSTTDGWLAPREASKKSHAAMIVALAERLAAERLSAPAAKPRVAIAKSRSRRRT